MEFELKGEKTGTTCTQKRKEEHRLKRICERENNTINDKY